MKRIFCEEKNLHYTRVQKKVNIFSVAHNGRKCGTFFFQSRVPQLCAESEEKRFIFFLSHPSPPAHPLIIISLRMEEARHFALSVTCCVILTELSVSFYE